MDNDCSITTAASLSPMFSRCYIVVNDCADNGLTPHNEEIKVMIRTQSASLKKRQLWVRCSCQQRWILMLVCH